MIAGGMSFYGLSNLILLEGTENAFSYAQALMYYKNDMEEIEKKIALNYILNRTEPDPTRKNQIYS